VAERVQFADAADVAITVANAAVTPPVSGDVPDERPDLFATITRHGGLSVHHGLIDEATLVVEAWGQTPADAHDLGQDVRSALLAASGSVVDGWTVYQVEDLAGPGDLPDPRSEQPRVTLTVKFPVRSR
jgi:hypothetical protein